MQQHLRNYLKTLKSKFLGWFSGFVLVQIEPTPPKKRKMFFKVLPFTDFNILCIKAHISGSNLRQTTLSTTDALYTITNVQAIWSNPPTCILKPVFFFNMYIIFLKLAIVLELSLKIIRSHWSICYIWYLKVDLWRKNAESFLYFRK